MALDYQIRFISINQEERHKEKAVIIPVTVHIKYKNVEGGEFQELIYLKEIRNQWKIVNIESPDRYVMFRTKDYILPVLPKTLVPKR